MEDLNNEIKNLSENPILSKGFKKKKIIIYIVRTLIALTVFYFLWDYELIKWAIYIYIPLNLFSLGLILIGPYLLNKKLIRLEEKLSQVSDSINEEE